MKLFEYEGKQLLSKYGIKIPEGQLLSNVIKGQISFPTIAKIQVLSGGRGKLGGIKKIDSEQEFQETINQLRTTEINGETVSDIYLEDLVAFSKELYFSITIDRNSKMPIILVCNSGGVDIESIPLSQILKVPLNPFIGLQDFMIKQISYFTSLPYKNVKEFVENIYALYKDSKSTLVEVNPLFVTTNNNLIAGDAKIIIENEEILEATQIVTIKREQDKFEDNCLKLGAVGVEIEDGNTAIITSGAGLGMASFDLMTDLGKKVKALVDLGGHVIHDQNLAEKLIQELKKLKPSEYFFNFYFQVASCTVLAGAIAKELGDVSEEVIVRMNGKDAEEAAEMLAPFKNIKVVSTIIEARDIFYKRVG